MTSLVSSGNVSDVGLGVYYTMPATNEEAWVIPVCGLMLLDTGLLLTFSVCLVSTTPVSRALKIKFKGSWYP